MTKKRATKIVEATPRPWKVHGAIHVIRTGEDWANVCEMSKPRLPGITVAKHEGADLGDGFDVAAENAALIVRAVNAHDAAVAALEAAAGFVRHLKPYAEKGYAAHVQDQISAALALATGKE